jgi:tetratricopeptide (TPR) repeat protein/transcriptional regulator with XRE-family HTH domain
MPGQRSEPNQPLLDALQRHLADSGLSQNELGRRLGYDGSQISRRLNGAIAWSRADLDTFAQTLRLADNDHLELLRLAGYVVIVQRSEATTLDPAMLAAALGNALPDVVAESLRALLPDLAALLAQGDTPTPSNPDLAELAQALAGQQIPVGEVQISFGSNNAINSVTIGHIAGRDVHVTNYVFSEPPSPDLLEAALRRLREEERRVERRQRLDRDQSVQSRERSRELRRHFVGRVKELADIRARIEELQPNGGYLLVTGVAGQGKSSILAALIDARGVDQTPAYFIRFSPGADERIALLRHLTAHLMVQYGLEDLVDAYLPETASAITLTNSFTMVLDRLHKCGQQAVIIVDGLDQIRPDRTMGERDLSFLPERLPPGIVLVIGTRPDDTLKPLKVLVPQQEYKLPPLSLDDFGSLLEMRAANLATHDREDLYKALHGNAFDLAFVVREISKTSQADVPALLERVKKNPQDIFAPALDRLRNDREIWRRAVRPILGCLLAANDSEPLSDDALATILDLDIDEVSDALLRLRGFLGETDRGGRARYYLYHLKLMDYLRGEQRSGERLFTSRNIEQWHEQIANWCERGKDGIIGIWQDSPDAVEQERRIYARQHYIMHLAASREYDRLWQILNEGAYGQEKRRYDPSTRSYALDLDIARQTLIDAAGDSLIVQVRMLPCLWKYSLLRCTLSSRANNYPQELFQVLVALGRSEEAINLAELLTDPKKKTDIFRIVGADISIRDRARGAAVFQRARQMADSIVNSVQHASALQDLAHTFSQARYWIQAHEAANAIADDVKHTSALLGIARELVRTGHLDAADTFHSARKAADAITEDLQRVSALSDLTKILFQAGQLHEAIGTFQAARFAAEAITEDSQRDTAFSIVACTLAQTQFYEQAYQTAEIIVNESRRTLALSALAQSLAQAGRQNEAIDTFRSAHIISEGIAETSRRGPALSNLASALAESRYFEQASLVIETIAHNATRVVACRHLVQALAHAQEWEQAYQTANAIADHNEQAYALSALSQALAQKQHYERARLTAEMITSSSQRVKALSILAQALAETGHQHNAVDTFNTARRIADAITDDFQRAKGLRALTRALARAQCLEQARMTTQVIADVHQRSLATHFLVQTLIRNQEWEQACQLANTIADGNERASAFRELAQAVLSVGRQCDTDEAFNSARQAAETIEDKFRRVHALSELAQALLLAGRQCDAADTFQNGREIAETIEDQFWRASSLRALAQALYRTEMRHDANETVHAARQAANSIVDDSRRASAMKNLVQVLATSQEWEQAYETVKIIPADFERASAQSTLARALAQAQEWKKSRQTADTITIDHHRASALCALAQALLQAGRKHDAVSTLHDARKIAEAVTDEIHRTEVFQDLARVFVQAGWQQEADDVFTSTRRTADAFLFGDIRELILRNLTQTLSQIGYYEQACQTTNAITNPQHRAEAHSNIIQSLFQASRPQEAVTLLIESWQRATTRDELLELFVIDASLLRIAPEIGAEFRESFAWVDEQLAIG